MAKIKEVAVRLFQVVDKHNRFGSGDIEALMRKEIEDRLIPGSDVYDAIQLEDIVKIGDSDLFLMDFIKVRETAGPGKVKKGDKLKGFDFNDDEYFGEATAILFDCKRKVLVMQYNHYGTKYTQLQYCLNYLLQPTLELLPVIDNEIQAKLFNADYADKLIFRVGNLSLPKEVSPFSPSLNGVWEVLANLDGAEIEVKITSGRSRKKALKKSIVDGIARYIFNEPEATRLVVGVREDYDSKAESLNLFFPQIEQKGKIMPDKHRMLPREERYKLLQNCHDAWINNETIE